MPQDAYRLHRRGDHRMCQYRNCQARRELEYLADETLFCRAAFQILAERHIDARDFWGSGYKDARAKADREIPEWLSDDVDQVTYLQAKEAIDYSITEELAKTFRI